VEGDWLVALEQSAGKGRQGRQWVSVKGNFYGSTLVRLEPGDPPPSALSLAAGLALIEAIDGIGDPRPLMLKWPNDLMLDGGKLGGILLERSEDRVAVGIGVNLAGSPPLPGRAAANLEGAVSPQAFAPLIAGSFARLLALWRSGESSPLVRAWQERAHLPGTRLTVHIGKDETLSGRFGGLEMDGALRLMLDNGGIEVIRAGDVDLH
jgi:BirA family biotin operon repressor/biotin-[acetyl-CoA-carboxylase] ligase